MNVAVTQGLAIMPPPFSAGLEVWSQTTGRPGSPTYATAGNAAFVPSDPDFGSCLELQKVTATARVRWMGAVTFEPGTYLRIRARIKAVAGTFPTVSVGAWAGTASGNQVQDITVTGEAVTLTQFGQVIEVSAIVGTGARPGVDMVWPLSVRIAHFGIDLTGPTGGVVRIDDIVIEDVTNFYVQDLLGLVDVRDFGARGDGVTEDRPAFVAAINAAGGRSLLVPQGSYRISSDLTIPIRAIFRGTLDMPDTAALILQQNFDYPSYESAFPNQTQAFRKGLQALIQTNQHLSFDLMGRRIMLSGPVDIASLAGSDAITSRRILRNGIIEADPDANWATVTLTRTASYAVANPTQLSSISNVAAIPVGAHISGVGVGREVYVQSRSVANSRITLSQPFHGGSGTRSYTFQRFQYMLDFSGLSQLRNFEFHDIEFRGRSQASAVILPEEGRIIRFMNCNFDRTGDRAITSIGTACQGMWIDNCQFSSSQQPLNAQDRTVIAFNVNGNDTKIRNNRASLWATFGVLNGSGHLILGNHFFGGDNQSNGLRQSGLVLTGGNVKTTITGNYIDNSFIEMSHEHNPTPAFTGGFSFGGLTITGNIFTANDVTSSFSWIVIRPFGPGQFLQGVQISGNVFRTINSRIDKADRADTTFAALDYNRFRNVIFDNNAYNGIDFQTESPTVVIHDQNSTAAAWTIGTGDKLPFGGWARSVTAIVMENPARDANDTVRYDMPNAQVQQGPNNAQVRLNWPRPMRGRALVTVRVDRPL